MALSTASTLKNRIALMRCSSAGVFGTGTPMCFPARELSCVETHYIAGSRPWARLTRLVSILRSRYSKFTAPTVRTRAAITRPEHCQMRACDRDLIRGGHYGQRSREPDAKAEHMAAPTNAALVKKVLANLGTSNRRHIMSAIGGKADIQSHCTAMGEGGSENNHSASKRPNCPHLGVRG